MAADLLPLGAAFLGGLLGSVHCAAMCGGIATGLGAASGVTGTSRASWNAALQLNLGRIGGYALAGALVGGIGGGVLRVVEQPALATGVRVALGLVMMLLALRLAGVSERWNLISRLGAPLWRALAPLQRRLLPARTAARRWALGMLWGWLPCGLSSSLLVVAWLQAEAWRGAAVMAAFGLGTLMAMLPLTWSGSRHGVRFARGSSRRFAALFVFLAGLLTATAPWLAHWPALHPALQALGCLPAQ